MLDVAVPNGATSMQPRARRAYSIVAASPRRARSRARVAGATSVSGPRGVGTAQIGDRRDPPRALPVFPRSWVERLLGKGFTQLREWARFTEVR